MPPRKTPFGTPPSAQPRDPSDLPSEHATCPEAPPKASFENPLEHVRPKDPLRSPSEHATCPEAPTKAPFGASFGLTFGECHVSRVIDRESIPGKVVREPPVPSAEAKITPWMPCEIATNPEDHTESP